jgi:hypothetical protein
MGQRDRAPPGAGLTFRQTNTTKNTPMDLRRALREQYHAGLAMLAECVEKCPEDLWIQGAHPRPFWRIAWHAAYFTQNYLVQDEQAFNASAERWPAAAKTALGVSDAQPAIEVEPYELPEGVLPLSRSEVLEYIQHVRDQVDRTVGQLVLDRADTGFSWYPGMTKLSHELMNLRHIQGHVGQLSELLMARGIDTEWIGSAGSP